MNWRDSGDIRMGDESIPRDLPLLKLMNNDDFDEGVMEEVGCLLRRRLFLNSGGHFLYVGRKGDLAIWPL